MRLVVMALTLVVLSLGKAGAGQVRIVDVEARQQQDGRYAFSVTLKHADNGWDHYADRWQVLDSDGKLLGERVLMHPHVNEQPFTRSLSGVVVLADLKEVSIRAHDKVHGDNPDLFKTSLPGR